MGNVTRERITETKGKMVNDKIIDRICEYLECRPRDIIEIE